MLSKISTASRNKMSASQFAVPSKSALPLYENGKLSRTHVEDAWREVDHTKDLTDGERAEARKRIKAAAKRLGIDTSSWGKEGAATDSVNDTQSTPLYTILDGIEDTSKPLRVRFLGATAGVVNRNNRMYPYGVLKDAVERMKTDYIAPGKSIGEHPHPKVIKDANGFPDFETSVSNSVWRVYDVIFDDTTGHVFFDAEILNTAKGQDVASMIRQNVPIGDSMRALGRWKTVPMAGKNVSVATYLNIPTFDCVMNPATEGAGSLQVITDAVIEDTLNSIENEAEGYIDPATDSIKFINPRHPDTGEQLTPHDPDHDGDVDFYTDPQGNVYVAEQQLSHETHAHSHLRMLNSDPDGDGYMLARQFMRKRAADKQKQSGISTITDATTSTGKTPGAGDIKPVTDSVKEEDSVDLQAIMDALNTPEGQKYLNDFVAERAKTVATEIAQPALDSVSAQEAERQATAAKAEAKSYIKERLDGMKEHMSEKATQAIMDSVGNRADNKEHAQALLDSTLDMFSLLGANDFLKSLGVQQNSDTSQKTTTRVSVEHEPKPWQASVDSIVAGFDDYAAELGHHVDPGLRKYNKPIVDKIINKVERQIGYEKLKESGAFLDSIEPTGDSISITTAQLLNQPTILEAVLMQAFQDVESLQFMMTDTFDGTEWRIPVETWNGNYQFDPVTATMDIFVPEGGSIPESNTSLTWQDYSPRWRRNAFSMTEDVQRALLTGPAKYPAIARAIYHLGFSKRRRLDDAAYYEMLLASDEYNYTKVTNEVAATANVTAVTGGTTNVTYKYQAQMKAGATFPLVRNRQVIQIAYDGKETTVNTYPLALTVTDATPQVQGYLDADGNIAGPSGATYAVDYENGTFYFNAASNVNPGATTPNVPTITYYGATNYDTWHLTVPSGTRPEDWYNTLLQQFTRSVATMGSAPRYKKPDLAIMSLNAAAYIENAAMWYKLQSPAGSSFTPDTETFFGSRSGVNFGRINAPWAAGDGRILLTQKGSTRYGIQTPYAMEGPFQKYDPATGNVVDAKVWYGKENSVLCTPQVRNNNGNILNPLSRTIRLVP